MDETHDIRLSESNSPATSRLNEDDRANWTASDAHAQRGHDLHKCGVSLTSPRQNQFGMIDVQKRM